MPKRLVKWTRLRQGFGGQVKNLKKAAERIKKAVKNRERIILYGDADMDGVSSVIILKEAIRNLGVYPGVPDIEIYFPDRETEGYGVNEAALNCLKEYAPALFITLDCGIGNFKEIKSAKRHGFEVMIIDHHKVLKKLPEAAIIVNPKQKGEKYSFKDFATAGVVFRLTEVLLEGKLTPSLRNNLLELTALATLADMMPQEKDNLEFLNEGLASLKNSFRPGLKVFQKLQDENPERVASRLYGAGTSRSLAQKIISACHAGGAKDHLNEGYLLLTSSSTKEAEILAKELLEKSYIKHLQIKEIGVQIEQIISKKIEEPIIFEGSESWPILMLGPVASKICNNYKKPVFLYSQREEESHGAVRTPVGVDGVKPMIRCSKFLETYGGHPQAAGFRIKNKNLEQFKKCLIQYFQA